MNAPSAFRVLRIRPLLRPNGTVERVEALHCACASCGSERRYSEPGGLRQVGPDIELICPDCGSTGMLSEARMFAAWVQQVRRDRVLVLAGLDPEALYGP
ncbi:hypothetical protein C1924_08645 [Stenotrophomonas sp. ESTM1D_MKCIP4_1]|uniref:hypothetical protein n=1 Tax=Stenotrophomonas sp. ESTM1D_MKCIP4_1 TaxID=2072414 RepID=UPI000D53CA7B|nr:hypothetical protein [Stenotrophomonas sp. ESTM1D_MKCIP4_1]AWH53242.1 hypothetical protein C1924_08645 [Stenotrophomonas sp. ESTM1D_MKCIP4_1]